MDEAKMTESALERLIERTHQCHMLTDELPLTFILELDSRPALRNLTHRQSGEVMNWLDATYTRLHPRKAAKEKAGAS